ncbi:MAG: hypothetical protein KatS3mg118_0571 [Paracoccaceae bacterium]|nr:MAG: hypothetical protein KatS3mg118_0571 [Paracoccaceae bacterium]
MAVRLPARRLTALLIAAGLAGGCTQGGFLTWEPDTEAERAMREKSEALQATVGEGALAGFGLGAVVGGLLGGTEGAFRGAQIGRLLGAGAGAYVAQLQREYATREEVLEAVARDIEATNAALAATIADMQKVLEERRAALAAARRDAAALERQRARTRRSLAEMEGAIEAASRREAFFGEARTLLVVEASAGDTAPLDPGLERLRARIGAMREIAELLAREL